MRMKYVFTQISPGKSFLIWILDNFMVTHYENIFGVLQIYLFSDINIICSLKKTISKTFYVSYLQLLVEISTDELLYTS